MTDASSVQGFTARAPMRRAPILLLVAWCVSLPSHVAASPATMPASLATIRKPLDDGAYPQAEAAARAFIAEEQKAGRSESPDAAEATNLLVEALWRG